MRSCGISIVVVGVLCDVHHGFDNNGSETAFQLFRDKSHIIFTSAVRDRE
jgi:hypothetical protein